LRFGTSFAYETVIWGAHKNPAKCVVKVLHT
jgi:hypothetical protein